MGFASAYLEERALFPEIIKEAPDKTTGIIVVVPACNEPEISKLLDSLAECSEPDCKVEIIIVVNAPDDSDKECIENNEVTIKNIESWKKKHGNCFFRLFAFVAETNSVKGWGVGLARKTGMDEAVRRFDSINNKDGVILSLDADCLVAQNYFAAVCNELVKIKDRNACSIYFEHPLSGSEFQEKFYSNITLYELHLRYYFQGLAYSGFPYVFHTVGSALAVKAFSYVKAGGMNRRRAGEDFYFIQKLVPEGGYVNLNSTVVYPSPRASLRVPFGTGASIGKLTEENSPTYMTYNIQAFKDLRLFFGMTEKIYKCKHKELTVLFKFLPPSLKLLIGENEWIKKMTEIKSNTSYLESFKKRFFGWFNMFRIVKYMNFVHQENFEKKPVEVSAMELLEKRGIPLKSKNPLDLLLCYRSMERST
jgi:hypothetical protein